MSELFPFACVACGRGERRHYPQCAGCLAWSTIQAGAPVDVRRAAKAATAPVAATAPPTQPTEPQAVSGAWSSAQQAHAIDLPRPKPITEIDLEKIARMQTGIEPLDRVLGGGLMPGHAILIGADPGAGKSTLIMQAAVGTGERILVASGEESDQQIADRARRIGCYVDRLILLADNDVDRILAHAESVQPGVIVIDSIQTMTSSTISGAPGSVSQVKECAGRLVAYCKARGIPLIMIGHITKSGAIAGPKTLEHLGDTTLHLFIDDEISKEIRFLVAHKNRFGATTETGAFKMCATGMIALSPEETPIPTPDEDDAIFEPLAQELLNRLIVAGGKLDDGILDRIGDRLDLEMWRETR